MKCPGQDTRYWKPGDIFDVDCPHCGSKVEFFKDEATRRCRSCRKTVVNPRMDFGCAAYCQYAADCLGEIGPELAAKRVDLLKDRVALEVKRLLVSDFQRIAHGLKVARHAEEIVREEAAIAALVLCAAHLHLLLEGPEEGGSQKALDVLNRLGAGPNFSRKVLDLIEDFRAGVTDSLEARVLLDAHRLALVGQTEEGFAAAGRKCLTAAGAKLASRLAQEELRSPDRTPSPGHCEVETRVGEEDIVCTC
ncbi:MAG: phosphohydrolase [Syntrophorhabdales bacterium]|jgi:hypothetical protein